MSNFSSKVLNFNYLMLDYYKKLNLNEKELAVILMIDHLLDENTGFITVEDLTLKMTLKKEEIDSIYASLLMKNYIDVNFDEKGSKLSIQPIRKILFKQYERDIFSEQELEDSEDKEKLREKIYEEMENLFKRQLNQVELSRIDEWIKDDISEEIIFSAIEESKKSRYNSVSNIDKIIINKLREIDI